MKNTNKKEVYLLIGLLAFLVGLLYYMLIYPTLKSNLSDARNDKAKAISEYNKVTAELATLDERKSQIKSEKGEALNKSKRFYPDIIEENILLELEQIESESNFKGDFTLDDVKVSQIEDMTPNNAVLPETSFDALNEAINKADDALNGKSSDKDVSINKDKDTSTTTVNNGSNNNTNSTDSNSTSEETKTSQGTCKVLTISVSYTDQEYKNLKEFLYKLENYNRIIAISDFKATRADNGNALAGSFNMELYAIPKITGNKDKNYSKWTKKDAKGKEELFAQGAATGAKIKKDQDDIDFMCILKQPNSVYPSVSFGKNDNKDTSSYVYADSTNAVNGTVTFTKGEDGNYYYKYTIGQSSYPKSTMGDGEKFEPSNNSVDIKVTSDVRDGSKDKNGLNLTVVNNTDIPVNIKVSDDSKKNPRFNLEDSKGTGNVYVK